MTKRSVSITGATGFVGWHTAEMFRAQGWQVRAIARPGSRKPVPDGVETAHSTLALDPLADAMRGTDLVVHCAGIIRAADEREFDQVNVAGTRAVVEAANRTKTRVLLMSSLAAGGIGTPERPRREEDPPAPINAYGRSKVAAETVVKQECRTPWTILRPCAVFGPRDRGFLPLFRLGKRGLFVLVANPSTPFSLVAIGDLTRAIVLAAESERAAGETCYVGHPTPRTSEDILRAIAKAVGRPYKPRRVMPGLLRLAATAGEIAWKVGLALPVDRSRLSEFTAEGFVCSVTHAREVLGFTAQEDFADAIARTAAWYREAGWL